jgi:hypothetical protein
MEMSTRLERAQKDRVRGQLTHARHQEIVLAERNKEIIALQAKLRLASKVIRAAEGWYNWMNAERSNSLLIWYKQNPGHPIPTLATALENYKAKARK